MKRRELRRIVEFLNGQMDAAEVLALEVCQFVGENRKTLVPRVIGQTVAAQEKKTPGRRTGKTWSEDACLRALVNDGRPEEVNIVRSVLKWAREKEIEIGWESGEKNGSFRIMRRRAGTSF